MIFYANKGCIDELDSQGKAGPHKNKRKLDELLCDILQLLGLEFRLKEIKPADIRVCTPEGENSGPELIIRVPLDNNGNKHLEDTQPRLNFTGIINRKEMERTRNKEKKERQFLKELNMVMEENYSDQDFNVERLATKLNLSQATLYRKIYGLRGINPCDYIRSFRLDKAARLLEDHFGLVIDVAFEVGFDSRIYFTKCFKEKFNITPSQFLEQRSGKQGELQKAPKFSGGKNEYLSSF